MTTIPYKGFLIEISLRTTYNLSSYFGDEIKWHVEITKKATKWFQCDEILFMGNFSRDAQTNLKAAKYSLIDLAKRIIEAELS